MFGVELWEESDMGRGTVATCEVHVEIELLEDADPRLEKLSILRAKFAEKSSVQFSKITYDAEVLTPMRFGHVL